MGSMSYSYQFQSSDQSRDLTETFSPSPIPPLAHQMSISSTMNGFSSPFFSSQTNATASILPQDSSQYYYFFPEFPVLDAPENKGENSNILIDQGGEIKQAASSNDVISSFNASSFISASPQPLASYFSRLSATPIPAPIPIPMSVSMSNPFSSSSSSSSLSASSSSSLSSSSSSAPSYFPSNFIKQEHPYLAYIPERSDELSPDLSSDSSGMLSPSLDDKKQLSVSLETSMDSSSTTAASVPTAAANTSSGKPKRKRRAPVLDPTTKLVRSQKHNQAEVRRRQRLNGLLVELAGLVGCEKPQKSSVLRVTIEKVKKDKKKQMEMEQKLQALQAENQQLKSMASQHNNNHSSLTPIYSSSSVPSTNTASTNMMSPFLDSSRTKQSPSFFSSGLVSHYTPSPHFLAPEKSNSLPSALDIIHSANLPMYVVDLKGRFLDCNNNLAELLGYTREDLLDPSGSFFHLTHPDSLSTSFSLLSALITGVKTVQRALKKYICKSGEIKTALLTCWMINDSNGQPNYVATIIQPVDGPLNINTTIH